jgi:hypothetical protein
MARFGKSNDPLKERERELRRQLDQLEADLRRLASPEGRAQPTEPKGPVRMPSPPIAPPAAPRVRVEGNARAYFNEQGLRKFDLIGGLRRLGRFLSGPTGYNRQMIRMLAAGSIDGLPVLRRERKKALIRFLFLFSLLLAILWGIGFSYFRDR